MKPIPIKAARELAKQYGYDQVVIYARRVGDTDDCGEHMTTYGKNKDHCNVAARIGVFLKYHVMGWISDYEPIVRTQALITAVHNVEKIPGESPTALAGRVIKELNKQGYDLEPIT